MSEYILTSQRPMRVQVQIAEPHCAAPDKRETETKDTRFRFPANRVTMMLAYQKRQSLHSVTWHSYYITEFFFLLFPAEELCSESDSHPYGRRIGDWCLNGAVYTFVSDFCISSLGQNNIMYAWICLVSVINLNSPVEWRP